MGGTCSAQRREKSARSILVGNHEGMRPLGRNKLRWG